GRAEFSLSVEAGAETPVRVVGVGTPLVAGCKGRELSLARWVRGERSLPGRRVQGWTKTPLPMGPGSTAGSLGRGAAAKRCTGGQRVDTECRRTIAWQGARHQRGSSLAISLGGPRGMGNPPGKMRVV